MFCLFGLVTDIAIGWFHALSIVMPTMLKRLSYLDPSNWILRSLINGKKVKEYSSISKKYVILLSIGWIVGNVRPNLKFSHHV